MPSGWSRFSGSSWCSRILITESTTRRNRLRSTLPERAMEASRSPVSSPASMRMARSTSCAAVRSGTRPISLRYIRTGSYAGALEKLLPAPARTVGLDPALLVLPRDFDNLDAFVPKDLLHVCEELLDLLGGELQLGQAVEHILRGDEPSLAAPGRDGLRRFVPGFVQAVGSHRLGRDIGGELGGDEARGVPHDAHHQFPR